MTLYAANPNDAFNAETDELAWALVDHGAEKRMQQVGGENGNQPLERPYDGNGIETANYFTDSVQIYQSSTTSLYEARLGRIEADEEGKIAIYIDDQAGANQKHRSTYDGVGYELIPEPSSALLALFGSLFFLRRRR